MSCGCSNNSWGRPQNNCGCERSRRPSNPCFRAAREIKDQIDDAQKAADCTQAQLNRLRTELDDVETLFEDFIQAGCVNDSRLREDDCGRGGCGCGCGCARERGHDCGCHRSHEPRCQSRCCR